MRQIKSPNEFFDLLDQIGNNKFVTIGYVMAADVEPPKVRRKNPATNRMKNYDDYTVFSEEGEEEIGALFQIKSYNFRYYQRKTVSQKYGEWKGKVNDIRQEFGLEPMQDRAGYKTANNYGNNGVENYSGKREDLQGHTYNPQNIYGAKTKSTVYAVNTEGHIIKALSPEQVEPYLKKKNQLPSGVSALRKMEVEEERIEQFVQKIKDLKFRYINFEADSVLYMAATVDGEKFVYINDNVKRAVNDIYINPSDFIAVAQERYKNDIIQMDESYRRFKRMVENKQYNNTNMRRRVRLTESDLHRIIKESVKRVIKENIYKGKNNRLYWEPAEDTKYKIGGEGRNGWPNLLNKDDNSETGYQISGWKELSNNKRRYDVWNSKARNSTDLI